MRSKKVDEYTIKSLGTKCTSKIDKNNEKIIKKFKKYHKGKLGFWSKIGKLLKGYTKAKSEAILKVFEKDLEKVNAVGLYVMDVKENGNYWTSDGTYHCYCEQDGPNG
jgi:hypothetical protein